RPKAVAIPHGAAVALVRWAAETFSAAELDGMLASTSVCFDLSVFELFVPLSLGGRVILAENALELPRLAAAGEVRMINTVPSAMGELVRLGAIPPSVRTVGLAGEPLRRDLVRRIYAAAPGVERVLNLYGPSETTTYSTWTAVDREAAEPAIGRPITGTRVVLVDRRGELVPVGVAGELLIGGAGLSRGYRGRPDLTAERFVPDPFPVDGEPGGRLYRTGDLARRRPGGQLDSLGRFDHQVKVRGFRIELGEVDAALLAHGAVRSAAVGHRDGEPGGASLIAYVETARDAVTAGELRDLLKTRLPEHMVPAFYLLLESLPLTPNGKVDRKALAKLHPERAAPSIGGGPRTPVEELVAGIFAEVLRRERVGVEEDFFALGGHSLMATRLTSRVHNLLGVELPVRTVFEAPTVAGLAGRIERELAGRPAGMGEELLALRLENRPEDRLALSFAQQRLWFLDQLDPGSALYNIPAAVRLHGELDRAALAAALFEIVRRHEVLRTTFRNISGEPLPVVAAPSAIALPVIDLAALPAAPQRLEAERLAGEEARSPFDLAHDPMLRVSLLALAAEEHTALVTMHHIASDGWSIGVLTRELGALYAAFRQGRPSPLAELAVQYADFAAWQRRLLSGERLAAEIAWWRGELAGAPPVLDLPTDRPRRGDPSPCGATHPLTLSPAVLSGLTALSRRFGATRFMSLLAVFAALLHRHAGQDDLPVGTP
ncbi:MAG TPA: condensation domain-containing protein, partial [Thermoanaerobaculia bacterium]